AVYSKNRFMVTKQWKEPDEQMLIKMFPEADIILLEGLKNSSYPKYFCDYPNKIPPAGKELADQIESMMDTE
ncbi:MAG: molybdopterin-guanine dinucleotide biosynthesis protein B, partial [Lachnospiraceae bacterium]|nr:molybdopterin-guanine dinucleotide biosynthesis protein B [Lachnospiraceae bacterium]